MQFKLLLLLFACIVCAVSTFDQKSRLEFINSHLKDFSNLLTARIKKDGTIGLFAKKEIKKNSKMLEMPESMLLSSFDDFARSYFFYEMNGRNQIDMLAGHLLFTKYKEIGGWNYNYYVKKFDKETVKETAGFWSEEQYEFYRKHLGYFPEHDFDLTEYIRKLKSIIVNNEPHLDQYQPVFPKEMFDLDELKWAYAMITKYSFPLTRWQWFEMHGLDKDKWRRKVPLIGDNPNINYSENIQDLITYESIPFKGKYNLSTMFQLDAPEVEKYFEQQGIVDPKQAEIELTGKDFDKSPLFDILYFNNPGLNEIQNLMRFNYHKFTLLANQNYQKGEEIRYLLNKYSNQDYLLNFGTLAPQNYFDYAYYHATFHGFQEGHFKFCYEIGCAPDNTTEMIYRFHRFQANHQFIKYLRIIVMIEDKMRGEGLEPNPFDLDAAKRVMARGRFNSPFRELLVWKYYFQALGQSFRVKRSTMEEDRLALDELKNANNSDQLKQKMLLNSIQQKEIAHRHIQYSLQKWSKVMLDKLLLGQIKSHVLGMLERQERTQPGFFTYSPLE